MKLEVGAWNKLPHYSVVGKENDFYVWVNEDGKGSASKWIKGRIAFKHYNNLKLLLKKDKKKFIELVKELHFEYSKQ